VLWREFLSEQIEIFRMTRVTFGIGSASHVSIRSLQEAIEHAKDAETIAAVLHDFYVDDLLTGANSAEEAWELIQKIIECLRKACFPLRKIASSSQEVTRKLPKSEREHADAFEFGEEDHIIKTLGVNWKPQGDTLGFTVPYLDDNPSSAKDKKKMKRKGAVKPVPANDADSTSDLPVLTKRRALSDM
jgi:hypothetical protein